MDQRYQVVRTVHPRAAAGAGVDFHEFRLLNSGGDESNATTTALIVTYQPRFVQGIWVLDNCFEEVPLLDDDNASFGSVGGSVDLPAPSSSFSWCATDHIPLAENPGRAAFEKSAPGNGRMPDRAWDYAHFNSVDKEPSSGEYYLISARHLDTVFAVSALDGSILWRLGGANSSFQQTTPHGDGDSDGDSLHFARQHDARFVDAARGGGGGGGGGDANSSVVTVSLFNNANDGAQLKDNPSRALVARLDLETMTARKIAEYGDVPPSATDGPQHNSNNNSRYISSNGMGNLQLLPNSSHALTSFGRHGAMAEYATPGGPPVFYANFTSRSWSASNYRTYLLPVPASVPATATVDGTSTWTWTGQPAEAPALWTYARTPTNLQTFYVSWNGDTAARTYRFWISDSTGATPPALDTFLLAGSWPKSGFETNYTIGSARPWSFAEALGADGTSLANSTIVRTYVPAAEAAKGCGKWHCFPDVTMLEAAELVPIDDAAALAGGKKAGGGLSRPSSLDWLEHSFALIGLGCLAWCVWVRFRRPSHNQRGYSPVEKEEDGRAVVI